mgnify:CR=1 FL=1
MVGDKLNSILISLGLTPEEFAHEIGVGKSSVYKILRGDTKKFSRNIAERIAHNYDQYSVQFILSLNKNDTSIPSESYFKKLDTSDSDKDQNPVIVTKSGSRYRELPNGKWLLSVPLIPYKAQASYINHFNDAEWISEQMEVTFVVDIKGQGVYRAFEIVNDSMDDDSKRSIPSGSIVLGRELGKQHWKDQLRINHYNNWIIVHQDTILCKEIIKHDSAKGIITCHSLNDSPEYSDFEINLNEVKQLFNIIKKQME